MTVKLLGFLGTNPYQEVAYKTDLFGAPMKIETPFVMEAIAKAAHVDEVVVFLTREARATNWEGEGKLEARLARTEVAVKAISIPALQSEHELWQLFELMLAEVNEQDSIIVDITHAFRHIPFLAGAVVSYLVQVKNIQVQAMTYGAFEAQQDGIAPIFDLSGFLRINQWTHAITQFLASGRFRNTHALARKAAVPFLKHEETRDESIKAWRAALDRLDELSSALRFGRGRQILENASQLAENIQDGLLAGRDHAASRALRPLFAQLNDLVEPFRRPDPISQGLAAIDWCLQFGLVQQAYTALVETGITAVISRFGLGDLFDLDLRKRVSKLISCKPDELRETLKDFGIDRETWRSWGEPLSRLIHDTAKPQRNDINHFGMRAGPASQNALAKNIEKLVNEFKALVE